MNNFQRKNPRIREKQVKLPYVFRSYKGFGPCRAWKNSDNKLYPYIVYKNSTVNLSLHILDGSIVSAVVIIKNYASSTFTKQLKL